MKQYPFKRTLFALGIGLCALSTLIGSSIQPAHACDTCGGKKSNVYNGQFALMGNGTIRSWVKLDDKGNPASLGVTFSETALSGLPTEMPGNMADEYVLVLPREAAAAGYDHISIDWNPKGHIPQGIYDVAHFDVHFYLIDQKTRDKITAVEKDIAACEKQPEAHLIPAGYIMPPGTAYPRMGGHAVDNATPELHGQPFTHTFVYGYYNGRMNFVEPMISKAFLETKPNATWPVKTPAAYPKRGYYPKSYSIKYDEARREYTVSLDDLQHIYKKR